MHACYSCVTDVLLIQYLIANCKLYPPTHETLNLKTSLTFSSTTLPATIFHLPIYEQPQPVNIKPTWPLINKPNLQMFPTINHITVFLLSNQVQNSIASFLQYVEFLHADVARGNHSSLPCSHMNGSVLMGRWLLGPTHTNGCDGDHDQSSNDCNYNYHFQLKNLNQAKNEYFHKKLTVPNCP